MKINKALRYVFQMNSFTSASLIIMFSNSKVFVYSLVLIKIFSLAQISLAHESLTRGLTRRDTPSVHAIGEFSELIFVFTINFV